MNRVPVIFAKLAALYKELKSRLRAVQGRSRISQNFLEYFDRYAVLRDQLREGLPDLYSDLPLRNRPLAALNEISRAEIEPLVRDMEYIFEVKANSELKFEPASEEVADERPTRVFISHGRSPDWREVQDYIEKDLQIPTLELAQEPNKGRTFYRNLTKNPMAARLPLS